MSATLPKNLALVGEDLTRATLQDAQRAARRRRSVTAMAVLALLALTTTAAVANGWLFDETPSAEVVPSLSGDSRTLLTGLGPEGRTLSSIATTKGSVCVLLTGFDVNCVPTFATHDQITWFTATPRSDTTLVWGIARDNVRAIEAVAANGTVTRTRLGNDAFYAEVDGSPPVRLVVHLADGTSSTVPVAPCPASTPDCPE
jgi:hypothetical protein